VKLLLEKNPDVNAQGGEYGNALQAASLDGHEQLVKMLLDRHANVNAQGGQYGNTLCAASEEGLTNMTRPIRPDRWQNGYSVRVR
jgi:ankyrin repeat protein